jgi:hypothetical protein
MDHNKGESSMKVFAKLALAVMAVTSLYIAPASAIPTPDEMRANYDICMDSDESWYRRFGQYIVAFDIYDATEACQDIIRNQRPRLAACYVSSGYIYAGYYCEEIGAKENK